MPKRLKMEFLRELVKIPNVGPRTAEDLYDLGIRSVSDLTGQDPGKLFQRLCDLRGKQMDPCVLYIFRAACYYVEHPDTDPERLRWWRFKNA